MTTTTAITSTHRAEALPPVMRDPEEFLAIARRIAAKYLAVFGEASPQIKVHPAHLLVLYALARYVPGTDGFIDRNIASLLMAGAGRSSAWPHHALGGLAAVYKILLGDYLPGTPATGLVHRCAGELRDGGGTDGPIKADDLLEVCPFLVMAGTACRDARWSDEAVRRYFAADSALLDPATGFFRHGRGCHGRGSLTPGHWARATGSMLAALTEILRFLPETHARRDELLRRFQQTAKALVPAQSPRGLWRQDLTDCRSAEETSGSALILYSLASGLAAHWLSDPFTPVVEQAWSGLVATIDLAGNDNITATCVETPPGDSPEYYRARPLADNDPHAFGPLILAAGAMGEYARSAAWSRPVSVTHTFAPPDPSAVETYFARLHEACEKRYNGNGSWGRGTLDWGGDLFAKQKNRESFCDHPLVRDAGWAVSGYLDAHRHRRNETYLDRARAGLEWLLTEQEPDGSFRLYTRKQEGQTNHRGCMFPTGIAASALAKGHEYLGEQRYLEASQRAAEWEKARPVTRNVNFNAFSIWHLAEHFRLTGRDDFLEAAIEKTKSGMLCYQGANGGWPGHNAWIWYHGYNLKAYAALLRALPATHPFRPTLTRAARAAVRYLVHLQQPTGALSPNAEITQPSSAITDALQAAALLYEGLHDGPTLNLIHGLVRYRLSPASGDPDLFHNNEHSVTMKGHACDSLCGLGAYLALAG
jgi:rhamnogalacturonyl hydrolase YesR